MGALHLPSFNSLSFREAPAGSRLYFFPPSNLFSAGVIRGRHDDRQVGRTKHLAATLSIECGYHGDLTPRRPVREVVAVVVVHAVGFLGRMAVAKSAAGPFYFLFFVQS